MKIKINITKEVLRMTRYCGRVPKPEEEYFVNPYSGIKKGEKINHVTGNCAITYALHKIFPYVTVESEIIILNSLAPQAISKRYIYIKLPTEAQIFIEMFDDSTPWYRANYMKPFSFEIEIPDEYLDSVDISEIHQALEESKTLELV